MIVTLLALFYGAGWVGAYTYGAQMKMLEGKTLPRVLFAVGWPLVLFSAAVHWAFERLE